VLLNLLSNAIKFGEGKPIAVVSRALPPTDDAPAGVEIEVIDHGIGIAEADLARIFDEFVQIGKPSGDQGTGLGLPISQRLARLLGGSLEVESRVAEGSTFRLRLPATVGDLAPAEPGEHAAPHAEPADEPRVPSERS
jgi:signal transduction histidine kinase